MFAIFITLVAFYSLGECFQIDWKFQLPCPSILCLSQTIFPELRYFCHKHQNEVQTTNQRPAITEKPRKYVLTKTTPFVKRVDKENTILRKTPISNSYLQGVSYLLERRTEVIWRSNMYFTKKNIDYQILVLYISLNQYKIKFLFNQLLTLKKPLVPEK